MNQKASNCVNKQTNKQKNPKSFNLKVSGILLFFLSIMDGPLCMCVCVNEAFDEIRLKISL